MAGTASCGKRGGGRRTEQSGGGEGGKDEDGAEEGADDDGGVDEEQLLDEPAEGEALQRAESGEHGHALRRVRLVRAVGGSEAEEKAHCAQHRKKAPHVRLEVDPGPECAARHGRGEGGVGAGEMALDGHRAARGRSHVAGVSWHPHGPHKRPRAHVVRLQDGLEVHLAGEQRRDAVHVLWLRKECAFWLPREF